jgi:hypothetical protein
VTWQVATGAATLSPTTSVSDGAGHSASAVTLATAGAGTVTATADGVPPVTFHITSISPCSYRWPFGFNATVTAALSSIDCTFFDGSFIDYYQMTTASQQAVRITMTAATFDAFLFFNTDTGVPVAGNDDDATSTNSEMKIIVAPGSYVVGANSYDPGSVGAYTLVSQPIASDIATCTVWFITPAVLTNQQLAATDCNSGGFYADLIAVFLEGGRSYTFTSTSTAFDAYLELLDGNGGLIAGDDNSAGGTNARITFTPSASDVFLLAPQSVLAGATGAYTLTLSAPFPAPPVRPTAPAAALRRRGTSWPALSAFRSSRPLKSFIHR